MAMEQDQIEQQLDWLDKERREDKKVIASLQKRVVELEDLVKKSNKFMQDLETQMTKTGVRLSNLDRFDQALDAHRKEVKKELDAQDKRAKNREGYAKEKYDKQFSELADDIDALQAESAQIPKLQEQIKENQKGITEKESALADLRERVKSVHQENANLKQSIQLLEEDRTSDKARATDLQGEVAALRKRLDEQRAQYELLVEAQKKADTRLTELVATEEERRDSQREFIETISRSKLDIEKSFTEWSKRFTSIEERAETLTTALQTYNEIEVSLRKAQSEFESIVEQISRRIHEITEMQRLGEERFRQEWTTFKSDDQKRWVNYTLIQDEQAKESTRRHERLNDRLTTLEEIFQDLQDIVQHGNEQMDTMMQGLLGVLREWLATNERFSDSR